MPGPSMHVPILLPLLILKKAMPFPVGPGVYLALLSKGASCNVKNA